ncbi:MAG: serine hydrolase [Pseudomonadota bacterium]
MRRLGKLLGRPLLAILIVAAVVAVVRREEIARLVAVNTLFEPDRIVENFSNMDRLFLHQPLPDGKVGSPLPLGDTIALPKGMQDWMAERLVTSLLVLKDGVVVFEAYYLGTGPDDQRISWSLAKSFLSALTGVIIAEGYIEALDDPVTRYAPQLKGTAYDSATVRHVLNMTTGVKFDEDYADFHSDINRMGRVLALGRLMDDFAAGLTDTFQPPGEGWQYVSIDTHVLGMVIRGATGRSIIELMGEKITGPLGLKQTPFYVTDGAGVAFVLGGLNMTTRDYARFGQMIADGGRWNGVQVVPLNWIIASTTPSAPTQPGQYGYGYQWWMPEDKRPGEFMGRGIYGQYLYIDSETGIVIVLTAADPEFRDRAVQRENIEWFRQISDSF